MSIYDRIARDLRGILSNVSHGFALRAKLKGHPITGFLVSQEVEVGGLPVERPTFRVAEADMPFGRARRTVYGDELLIEQRQPYGWRRYTVESIEPETHGEVLLILQEA